MFPCLWVGTNPGIALTSQEGRECYYTFQDYKNHKFQHFTKYFSASLNGINRDNDNSLLHPPHTHTHTTSMEWLVNELQELKVVMTEHKTDAHHHRGLFSTISFRVLHFLLVQKYIW